MLDAIMIKQVCHLFLA